MSSLTERKRVLRAHATEVRSRVRQACVDASGALDHFVARIRPAEGCVVSGYLPVGDEFDALPFLDLLARRGHPTALPVVAGKARPLVFRAWGCGQPLIEGNFGVPVPPETAATLTPALLIVPMLAFDRRGYRLGYGGGFYDRTLAELRTTNPATVAVGIAFAGQEVEAAPHDDHDQPLDWIVTEQAAIDVARDGSRA